MEGRAARRRLPAVVVGRAHRLRGRRRRDRGERRACAADVLDCYPALDPGRVHVVHNGIDTDFYHPDPARDAVVGQRDRPRPAQRRVRRADHPPEGRAGTSSRPPTTSTRPRRSCCCAGAPDTPEIAAETETAVGRAVARPARASCGCARCCRTTSVRQVLSACHGVRLPVGLRAARDREPGGDGVRDRRGRARRRRHPRGRRRRRAPACWSTTTRTRSEAFERRPGRRGQRAASPTRRGRPAMGAAAGSAPCASSRGRRPPAAPSRSTTAWSDPPQRTAPAPRGRCRQ